jgi:hypothetical protein
LKNNEENVKYLQGIIDKQEVTIKQMEEVHTNDEAEKLNLLNQFNQKCRECEKLEVSLVHAININKVHESYRDAWVRKKEVEVNTSGISIKDKEVEKTKSYQNGQSFVSTIKEELFHFIHPSIDSAEEWSVHNEVKRLVTRNGIQEICNYLFQLAKNNKILLPLSPLVAYQELVRMGMPNKDGFNEKTFQKYYMR